MCQLVLWSTGLHWNPSCWLWNVLHIFLVLSHNLWFLIRVNSFSGVLDQYLESESSETLAGVKKYVNTMFSTRKPCGVRQPYNLEFELRFKFNFAILTSIRSPGIRCALHKVGKEKPDSPNGSLANFEFSTLMWDYFTSQWSDSWTQTDKKHRSEYERTIPLVCVHEKEIKKTCHKDWWW